MSDGGERLRAELTRIWGNPPGWRALAAVNHSAVGRRFVVTGLAFFAVGGLLAMLMRVQLAVPGNDFIDQDTYNALFTLHGTTMMFLFAVPILEGFAVYLVPKLIGARDLLFPRLGAYGYWCYLFGGLLLYAGVLIGAAPDGGWFMYPPLTGPRYSPGPGADFWLLGVTLAEVSAVTAAVELASTILTARAPGMTLARMPIFAWYMLVVAFMILIGFPPLILGSVLLELERAFAMPFYDPRLGGDPLLWQHLFWLFGHPEVYIIFLPAVGMLATLVPVLAQRPLASYAWVVIAVIATGFLSFGLWVHHMYATGLPYLALSFFAAASMAVAVPTGIQVFTLIATLWPARPRLSVPMLYVFGFLFVFVLGGLTGVMVALVPFDWQAHDSHFVVAHLHYVLIGGMVFPLFAALYFWLPHFSGRLPSRRLGYIGFWLLFVGFNLTFLVMHLAGLLGMPRRVYTYSANLGLDWPNLLSTVGSFVMSIGVAAVLLDLLLHLRLGRRSPPNPWRADSLDWAMPLPPPPYNFASIPAVDDRHPLWRSPALAQELARGDHYLARAEADRRELLATDPITARPIQVVVVPGNSWSPLIMALATAAIAVGVLLAQYWLSALGLLVVITVACAWAARRPRLPARTAAGHGLTLPFHTHHPRPPGWWGTALSLLADATIGASLLFAYFYYWTVNADWPPQPPPATDWRLPLALAALAASSGLLMATQRLPEARRSAGATLSGAAALQAVFVGLGLWWLTASVAPDADAYGALLWAIAGWLGLHALGCVSMAAAAAAALARERSERRSVLATVGLFWHYSTLQGLALAGTALAFPRLA